MSDQTLETVDPRIRRTRQLLQQALGRLLEKKEFDRISVHEIADAATVNRATFYDHYADKFALLECMVAARFHELLAERQVEFDGSCPSAMRPLIRTVCDYLEQIQGVDVERPLQPHTESAVIAVVRRILLEGIKHHQSVSPRSEDPSGMATDPAGIDPEMMASIVSWAIYGGAKEWVRSSNRSSAGVASESILKFVNPIFDAGNRTT
jgi:AcrR family transcriptional regulator